MECARRGADVLLTYKTSMSMAENVADEVRSVGVLAEVRQLDIADPESIAGFVSGFGADEHIDAVVLNAGTWAGGRVGQIDDGEWWSVVETNLRGAYLLTKGLLEPIRRSISPSITIVSSVVGITGFPGDTAYASSKGALIVFAKSLAKEVVRDGIRVNVIAPGFVTTDLTAGLEGKARAQVLSEIPMARAGTPEEIAKGIGFLVFDGSYMTGSVLTIDGGWSSR